MKKLKILLLLAMTPIAFAQQAQQGNGDGSNQVGALGSQYVNSANATDSNNGSNNTTNNVSGSQFAAGSQQTVQNSSTPATQTIIQKTVPHVNTPNLSLSNGADTCLGSASIGTSILGFGLSGGRSITDANCVMLKQSRFLAELGLKDAAIARLLLDDDLRKSMILAYPALVKLAQPDDREAALELIAKNEQSLAK